MRLWNRRRHERFNTLLDVYYMKFEDHAVISSLSVTKNISSGGLCMLMTRNIRKKEVVMAELKFAGTRTVAVLAKVRWIKPAERTSGSICGLKFIWSTSESSLDDCIEYAKTAQAAV